MMEVMVAVVLSGSSLSFAAVVATVLADLAEMAVVAMTADALSGSYLSFAAVVATDSVVAEIPAVNYLVS